MSLVFDILETPIGRLLVVASDGSLRRLHFEGNDEQALDRFKSQGPINAVSSPFDISARLRRYFEGDLEAIDRIPVDQQGTEFQKQVWAELRRVPAGAVASYSDIASRIGRPQAVRAVGAANGANPCAIVVPCHRIIGANGALTGYRGGLERKRWLLTHEGYLLV